MIQVNRIYLIFNRLVTKKFLVDTSETAKKRVRNGKYSRMGARFAAGLHDTTVTENLTAFIVWNRHGTENPI